MQHRFHIKVREHRNRWICEYPKSWRKEFIQVGRRREQRLFDKIERFEQAPEDCRG